MNSDDNSNIEVALRDFLAQVGEDVNREGLTETPKRFIKQIQECLSGYQDDPKKHLKFFDSEGYDELVVVRGISFSSICEHHLLPFFGQVDIAYIPGKKILGLSKFARVVDAFSKRLQVQERLTQQLADFLDEQLKPELLLVRVTAAHTCMIVRGVSRPQSQAETLVVRGDQAGREHLIAQFNTP